MKTILNKVLVLLIPAVLVAGCSSDGGSIEDKIVDTVGLEDYSIEYKKSKQVDTLELPPDLSSSRIDDSMVVPGGGSATYSEINSGNRVARRNSGILPKQEDIRVERDGDKRWLVINGPVEQVWAKVREFWIDLGFLLTMENPQIGIMETDWKENRADIPQDFIRSILSTVLESAYSAPTRDSFRVRLERGESSGQTEVFISHRGVLEKVSGETTVWETRPAEPDLEAEMLRRLMIFMGTEDQKARARLAKSGRGAIRARLIKDRSGDALVDYRAGYPRAWRVVGLALDRVGFTVEDRDRSNGIYYVRYSDPLKDMKSEEKGILSSLIFWGSDEKPSEDQYQVTLIGDEASTQILVMDKDGRRDRSNTAGRILTLIYEQIR